MKCLKYLYGYRNETTTVSADGEGYYALYYCNGVDPASILSVGSKYDTNYMYDKGYVDTEIISLKGTTWYRMVRNDACFIDSYSGGVVTFGQKIYNSYNGTALFKLV